MIRFLQYDIPKCRFSGDSCNMFGIRIPEYCAQDHSGCGVYATKAAITTQACEGFMPIFRNS